ncbi:MAG TPA: FlgD immunoglobulin-like domain containing protein, partial [Candidatus Krumholzibacteria bacterium]|nr:FlgD immunoglobulin-like domain containing protein [Candidatus Krumholzibacteria bacterium]
EYALPSAGHVRLRVYDARGALVRTLVDGTEPHAAHRVTWDGSGNSGNRVASGVYLLRIESAGATRTQKITLLK